MTKKLMKTKTLLLLAFFFVANILLAQDRKLIESYKQPESGIMLFPNKTFAAWTYMTIIRGYYQKRPDGVYHVSMISMRVRAISSWDSSSVTDSIVGLILCHVRLTSSSIQ